MGGRISKEGKTQTSDQIVLLPYQFMQPSEWDENNYHQEPDDSIQLEKKEKPMRSQKPKPIKIRKLKPIKSCKLSKLVMEGVDLAITLVSDMKKAYSEGKDLQEKEIKILGFLIRGIERNYLENFAETLKMNLKAFLEKLAMISEKFQALRNRVDKKLKSTKLWGKILGIFFNVAYAVVYVTVYVILVISTLVMIPVTSLVDPIWELLKRFLRSIGKRVKSLWKKKEEELEEQKKVIGKVLIDLDGIKDKITQLLEENGDHQNNELSDILQKITVLQKQGEEFKCYMESKKKTSQELLPTEDAPARA